MKTSMAILFVLVVLSLVFSLISLLILVENHIGINYSNPKSPTIAPTPKPTPIPSKMSISYSEISRDVGNNTKVTLMVNATFIGGNDIDVSYSQFHLQLYAPRSGVFLPQATVNPLNSGNLTIGVSHSSQVFELQFVYSTTIFNGMDYDAHTYYSLIYSGSESVTWVNQGYY